jgi:hypothetical protein
MLKAAIKQSHAAQEHEREEVDKDGGRQSEGLDLLRGIPDLGFAYEQGQTAWLTDQRVGDVAKMHRNDVEAGQRIKSDVQAASLRSRRCRSWFTL